MGSVVLLDELVDVSRRYGADPAYCLAGGGNTSLKDGDRLYVKASGCALGSITPEGFVLMRRSALQRMLERDWPTDPAEREAAFGSDLQAARINPELGQRPSVETLLHHLIPGRLVVHTHPAVVNALTCCTQGRSLAERLFGPGVIWQPYVDPGVTLARALARQMESAAIPDGQPRVILLENHGLFVAAQSAQEIEAVTTQLVTTIQGPLDAHDDASFGGTSYAPVPERVEIYLQALARVFPQLHGVSTTGDAVRPLVATTGGRDTAMSGPLTPDQIVYCRSLPLWIEEPAATVASAAEQVREAWQAYIDRHGFEPWVVLLAGGGVIAVRERASMAATTLAVYGDAAGVCVLAHRLGGVQPMTPRDRAFIEGWEVESYRRAVAEKQSDEQ